MHFAEKENLCNMKNLWPNFNVITPSGVQETIENFFSLRLWWFEDVVGVIMNNTWVDVQTSS